MCIKKPKKKPKTSNYEKTTKTKCNIIFNHCVLLCWSGASQHIKYLRLDETDKQIRELTSPKHRTAVISKVTIFDWLVWVQSVRLFHFFPNYKIKIKTRVHIIFWYACSFNRAMHSRMSWHDKRKNARFRIMLKKPIRIVIFSDNENIAGTKSCTLYTSGRNIKHVQHRGMPVFRYTMNHKALAHKRLEN